MPFLRATPAADSRPLVRTDAGGASSAREKVLAPFRSEAPILSRALLICLSVLQFAFSGAGFCGQVKEAGHPAPPPAFYLEWHYVVS